MTKQKVTAVFDIGKTNKKFFLFNENFQEVYREYTRFEEITDEDGYPTEDLVSLQTWLKEVFNRILEAKEYNITAINFSTYGASLVHLDEEGQVLTPLYNYTKPLDSKISKKFYDTYGPEDVFAQQTGSDNAGMLNAGMQLYWIKYQKPEVFNKIKYSLHLPQYVSYIFTGIPVSEHTSIGCHTALWDYRKKDYHTWVYQEKINKILPPLVSSETSINMNYNGKRIKIGVGIHDSSAALLPYVRSVRKAFVLVSTGTWSISLNPFTKDPLNASDVAADCINYMRINGKPVKSSRIYLGGEYSYQVKELIKKFEVAQDAHKDVVFDNDIFYEISKDFKPSFRWKYMYTPTMPQQTNYQYIRFEEAYHHLMMELVQLQVASVKAAIGEIEVNRLYVDGGFTDNEVYIQLLSHYMRTMKLRTTNASLGSALGAAISISDTKLNSKFLKRNYALKKHLPFIAK